MKRRPCRIADSPSTIAAVACRPARAFNPLTQSVFWSSLAFTLIGGIIGGTILTLVFLPALYALWFKIKPAHPAGIHTQHEISICTAF
jgi:hypothetical protein